MAAMKAGEQSIIHQLAPRGWRPRRGGSPDLELESSGLYVMWKRYQKLSPAAAALLDQMSVKFDAIART